MRLHTCLTSCAQFITCIACALHAATCAASARCWIQCSLTPTSSLSRLTAHDAHRQVLPGAAGHAPDPRWRRRHGPREAPQTRAVRGVATRVPPAAGNPLSCRLGHAQALHHVLPPGWGEGAGEDPGGVRDLQEAPARQVLGRMACRVRPDDSETPCGFRCAHTMLGVCCRLCLPHP